MADDPLCPVCGSPLRERADGWVCDVCAAELVRGVPPDDEDAAQGTDDWYEAYVESLEDARRLRKPGAGGGRRRTGRFSGKKSLRGGKKLVIPWDEEDASNKPSRRRRVASR